MKSDRSDRTLWIVRHGLRIDFADPDWVTAAEKTDDPPLHPTGIRQAEETADRLIAETIDHVFTSPFRRTVQTASIIADRLRKRLNVEAGFSEWLSSREFSHKPLLPKIADLHAEFACVDAGYSSAVDPVYPEDRDALDARTETALTRILSRHEGNVLIVSHGSPMLSIHRALTGAYPDSMPPMASITRFDLNSGIWTLICDPDSSHLTNPDLTNRIFYSNGGSGGKIDK